MRAYDLVLLAHSAIRWLVLLLTVAVALRALAVRVRTPGDVRLHVALISAVDLQFLLGLGLYLLVSPTTSAFFADPRAGLKDAGLRFFGVEHITGMLIAIAILHQGRPRQSPTRRRVLLTTLVPLAILVVSIPWPPLPYGRPLLRGLPEPATSACPPAYAARCAACHGARGHGDGPAASSLRPPPRNFTDPAWARRTDDELAALIRDGGAKHGLSAAMPAQTDLPAQEIEALVGCVRRLQRP
jgi:hypothetical protein